MTDELQDEFSPTPTLPDTQGNSQTVDAIQTFNYGWGTLVPIICGGNLRVTALTEECYSVGRAPSCDISLTKDEINSTFNISKISKIHFKVFKGTDDNLVYIEDLSANGTFINGEKIGKNRRVILTSSDEISMATPTFKAFTYIDSRRGAEHWLSDELSSNFLILRHLGTGGFGDVKLVINKKTFQKYAMKKVENGKDRERSVFNEVNILKKLKHPCIISFENIYETPNAVFIALEYMPNGNLLQRIHSKIKLPEGECKLIFYQLMLGVKYLHEEGIVHRDLKPENVLLEIKGDKKNIIVKITDFGLSKILHSATNLRTACGTLSYTAPEVIKVTCGTYSRKVDIWSLGVILFYCLSGKLPFSTCNSTSELAYAIIKGAYVMYPNDWQLISINAKSLVIEMLRVNPLRRICTKDVLLHSWFKDDSLDKRIPQLIGDMFLNFSGTNENLNDNQEYNVEPKRSRIEQY
ncbi:hypothetical protein O3M35_010704 [Rhynocoris fuscipes]|uniref:non-specific serine/threonine protein kinase n=1 Tax=Rhynocoris fuscipes TaxID=488301 RepID=A0AAW1D001_9HEMI